MEFLTRLFPHVRRLQRDAIRIRSEREEWRQRYTSLHARTQQVAATPAAGPDADPRKRVLLWAAEQARALPGDFIECGQQRAPLRDAISELPGWSGLGKAFHSLTDGEPLAQVVSLQVALLSIATESTAPAEYFWPRLVSGAIIYLHDYSRSAREPLGATWEAFAAAHETPILPFPTGQGILIKR